MTFEDARAAICGRLDNGMTTSHPATLVEYENRVQVDLAVQTAPYVSAELVYNDGDQVSMETNPGMRYSGSIWLGVHVKQGEGAAAATPFLQTLATLFKAKSFGGVVTRAPKPLPQRDHQGWVVYTLRIPFHFDDFS